MVNIAILLPQTYLKDPIYSDLSLSTSIETQSKCAIVDTDGWIIVTSDNDKKLKCHLRKR